MPQTSQNIELFDLQVSHIVANLTNQQQCYKLAKNKELLELITNDIESKLKSISENDLLTR